jgi:HEPN domain-containing protein
MPNKMKVTLEWFEKGKHDIEGAKILFDHGHYTDTVALLIHQAIEKYFKGFLIFQGWKLKKIHDLVKLLNELVKYKPEFARFEEDCLRITEYYFESRYPGRELKEYPRDEIRDSLSNAEIIIKGICMLIDKT